MTKQRAFIVRFCIHYYEMVREHHGREVPKGLTKRIDRLRQTVWREDAVRDNLIRVIMEGGKEREEAFLTLMMQECMLSPDPDPVDKNTILRAFKKYCQGHVPSVDMVCHEVLVMEEDNEPPDDLYDLMEWAKQIWYGKLGKDIRNDNALYYSVALYSVCELGTYSNVTPEVMPHIRLIFCPDVDARVSVEAFTCMARISRLDSIGTVRYMIRSFTSKVWMGVYPVYCDFIRHKDRFVWLLKGKDAETLVGQYLLEARKDLEEYVGRWVPPTPWWHLQEDAAVLFSSNISPFRRFAALCNILIFSHTWTRELYPPSTMASFRMFLWFLEGGACDHRPKIRYVEDEAYFLDTLWEPIKYTNERSALIADLERVVWRD